MKYLVPAAILLSAVSSALNIPRFPHPPNHHVKDKSITASRGGIGISVLFSVPCDGCLPNSEEELDIELIIAPSTSSCQTSAITINDVKLTSESSISFKANTTREVRTHEVIASWETACLRDDITLLSFHINEVRGSNGIQPGSGFSFSLKQGSSPSFMRLEPTPVQDISDVKGCKKWLKPQREPDFVVVGSHTAVADSDRLSPDVQEQLQRLEEIKARIGRLQHRYMRQERRILKMITKDFHTCSSPACLIQTAIRKAPDFYELLKAHFRCRPDWSKLHRHRSHDGSQPSQIVELGNHDHEHKDSVGVQGFAEDSTDEFHPHHHDLPPPPPPEKSDLEDSPPPLPPPPPPPPMMHEDCQKYLPPPPPFGEDASPPPPGPPPPHCQGHHGPPHMHGDHPPGRGHHKPGPPRPHFLDNYGPHRHPFFFSLGTILFFAIVASLLFKCVRSKTGLFRNKKRSRDRAARREECRTRAAYKRAAMRHQWRKWWLKFRQPESTSDYEEKRERILGQEDVLEDVMQSEIRDLRRAHEIVGDLMRAEEGRQRLYHEANFGTSPNAGPSTYNLQRHGATDIEANISALPAYLPPPPSYDQELEGDMTVVDGFSYTPSATDDTPDSSVVDCHQRISFETDTTLMK